MLAGKKLLTALTSIIPAAHEGQLTRMVDFFDLTGKGEPQFLYASGRALTVSTRRNWNAFTCPIRAIPAFWRLMRIIRVSSGNIQQIPPIGWM